MDKGHVLNRRKKYSVHIKMMHQKLENIVRVGKLMTIRHEGKTYYISKTKI